jgi:hypothetical protein
MDSMLKAAAGGAVGTVLALFPGNLRAQPAEKVSPRDCAFVVSGQGPCVFSPRATVPATQFSINQGATDPPCEGQVEAALNLQQVGGALAAGAGATCAVFGSDPNSCAEIGYQVGVGVAMLLKSKSHQTNANCTIVCADIPAHTQIIELDT